jgi:hypothetical protein
MLSTKPNRAQRRAMQSNGKPKLRKNTPSRAEAIARDMPHDRTLHVISNNPTNAPQIAAPSRATRYAGLT